MSFINQYPIWYYLLCLLLGAGLSFLLYYKDKRLADFSKPLVYLLQFLRFLSLSTIALLIIAPLLRYTQEKSEEPIFVVLTDNSQSMLFGQDSSQFVNSLIKQNSEISKALVEKGKVEFLNFGEYVEDSTKLSFTDRLTNFQSVLNEVDLRYQNRNLGAIIISSDGIYNQGIDPRYVSLPSTPIFSIAYGDTSQKRDLVLERILNNNIAFLGNEFPIEVQIQNTLNKSATTEIKVYQSEKLIKTQQLNLSNQQSFIKVPFTLTADKLGIQKYNVILQSVEGEYSQENNSKEFYIDVLDGRQNVLIVSNAPHPDIAALQSAILEQENFKVTLKSIKDDIDLEPFDLVILHDIPNKEMSSRQFLFKLMDSKKSVLFIFGSTSNPEILKRYFTEAKFVSNSSASNEATPIQNDNFPLFQIGEKNSKILKDYPPLLVKGGYFKNPSKSLTAYYQKIGAVNTKFPLIDFWDREGQKFGFIYGEGLWRWKIANYRANKNHEAFNDIINKTVQYLSLKADKSFFRVNQENTFFENEAIKIFAQLYNESYELINEAEVQIKITNDAGVTYDYAMSQSQSAYFLKINELPVGSYSYTATTDWGGKVYSDDGQFSVKSIKFEQLNTTANHQLLNFLSSESGGKLFYPNAISDLITEIKAIDTPNKLYEIEEYESIINIKWIFFVLITFISLEWFIRKRQGAY